MPYRVCVGYASTPTRRLYRCASSSGGIVEVITKVVVEVIIKVVVEVIIKVVVEVIIIKLCLNVVSCCVLTETLIHNNGVGRIAVHHTG